MTFNMLVSFFPCSLIFTKLLYFMCLSRFFGFLVVVCSFFNSDFLILTLSVPSGKRKIKIPALTRHQSSQLFPSPQKHKLPLQTWNLSPSSVVLEPIPLLVFLSRDNQILSSVSWWIHAGTFGDTCSSASSSPPTASTKQTSKLKLTENSSQTRADDHSILWNNIRSSLLHKIGRSVAFILCWLCFFFFPSK